MAEPAKELLYSFDAIDHLDDETKRLYRIWLDRAVSRTMREGRSEVTIDDVKSVTSEALKVFGGA